MTFLKPYSKILPQKLDLSKPDHVEEGLGYGRLICVFKFRTVLRRGHQATEHHVAYLEELWPYTPQQPDYLMDEYGHKLLYSVNPRKVCYVMEIQRILGPAAIFRNPGMPNIPRGALTSRNRKKCNGQFPLNHLATEGCELFRLNVWLMRWGCKSPGLGPGGGFKVPHAACSDTAATVGGETAAHSKTSERADPGIRIGDLMLGKYQNWPSWYECKVVSAAEGGKWVVEWDDHDPHDTLKEPRHLKKRPAQSSH